MKTTIIRSMACTALLILTLISCARKDQQPDNFTLNQIDINMKSEAWRVSYFSDFGNDETTHFIGDAFTFGGNGIITARNNVYVYQGFWSITDCQNNHGSVDDLHFNINFDQTNDFEDLNNDWDIFSHSPTLLVLIDKSGGGGGTDYLTFARL